MYKSKDKNFCVEKFKFILGIYSCVAGALQTKLKQTQRTPRLRTIIVGLHTIVVLCGVWTYSAQRKSETECPWIYSSPNSRLLSILASLAQKFYQFCKALKWRNSVINKIFIIWSRPSDPTTLSFFLELSHNIRNPQRSRKRWPFKPPRHKGSH